MFYSTYDEETYNKHTDKCIIYKNLLAKPDKWSTCCLDDINVGDYIYVEYCPSSLKNLYEHTPECGQVVEIKNTLCIVTNNNYKDIIIKNHLNDNISIIKDWLGYYSKSYEIYLEKINIVYA